MSIFDRIKSAIFGEAHAAQPANDVPATSTSPPSAPPSTSRMPATSQPSSAPQPSTSQTTASPIANAANVDVTSLLDAAVKKSGQILDWKHSIVDLMKALGMEATLAERKELAAELDYQGDLHDTVKMNTFLHKALLQKLAQNGGKVPSDLVD